MATKDSQRKRTSTKPAKDLPETEHHAPSGRGGAAMGRTVGLPFGGARPRKRNAKALSKNTAKARQ